MEKYTFTSDYRWVIKVLDSSENLIQIETSRNLLEALISKYKDYLTDCGKDCLHEDMIREEFEYYLDKKLDSLMALSEEY
jgi:hypothetical protein